jgi:hypothetical protein
MFKSIKRATLVLAIASLLMLALAGPALATGWSDLPQSLLDSYGLTADEVSAISQGFPDGTWHPDQMVTRAQFTKMAIGAFKIMLTYPATPSFADVDPDDMYYQHIESARAAGLVNGVTATTFDPYATLAHQHGYAIILRWAKSFDGVDAGVLGDAPAIAMGNLFQATPQALDDAVHDAVVSAAGYGLTCAGELPEIIDPAGGTTRIQAAAALVRAVKLVKSR